MMIQPLIQPAPPMNRSRCNLKVTRYLERVDLSKAGVILLFGGLAGRLVEVPRPYLKEIDIMLADPNSGAIQSDTQLGKLLQEQGLLVPASLDELNILKSAYEKARQMEARHMELTLCPTLACNFRCTYCYQKPSPGVMQQRIQDLVIQFCTQKTPGVQSLSVSWFGGEPLIALPVVERLSKAFMDMFSGDKKYQASIVTNGSLLTPPVSRLLADLKVRRVQITLDGPRRTHNKRRPFEDGTATFDTIINNIVQADPRLNITVRVNIDRNNASKVSALFDQLDAAGLQGKVGLSFASVQTYTDACAGYATNCLERKQWAKLHGQLQLESYNRGYGGFGLPQTRLFHCMADNQQGWLVNPSGQVFKCWNDATQPQNAVFDLSNEKQTKLMEKAGQRWKSWNPFDFPDCAACNILPFCMGGCPYMGLNQNQPITHGYCSEAKENLQEKIAISYLSFRRSESTRQLKERLNQFIPEETLNYTSTQER